MNEILPYVSLIAALAVAIMGYANLRAKVNELDVRRREDNKARDKEVESVRSGKSTLSVSTSERFKDVYEKMDSIKETASNNFTMLKDEIHSSEKRIITEINKQR